MDLQRYAALAPKMEDWIQHTLKSHANGMRSVSSFNFKRLPFYFSDALLRSASVVVVEEIPIPELQQLGFPEFAAFERQAMSGVTYLNTYFVESRCALQESLHLHELVHVVQWEVLGPSSFLMLYAAGLVEFGYHNSPLEGMAYRHQGRFETDPRPYTVERQVRSELLGIRRRYNP
jgi:hypothetical protein